MSVAAPVSLEHYLQHPTEPESEYFEGEVIQKATGTNSHSRLQLLVGSLLLFRFEYKGVGQAVTEQSLLVREGVILIPDVCVLQADNRETGIVTHPPLLCVEILSPSDRFSYTVKKCQEYLNWGVPVCWILDPELKQAWNVNKGGMKLFPEDGWLEAGAIALPLEDVFPRNAGRLLP